MFQMLWALTFIFPSLHQRVLTVWDCVASENPALGRESVGGFFCVRLQSPDLCRLRQKAAEHYSWPVWIHFCSSSSSMGFKIISCAPSKVWILSWCEQAQLCFGSCTRCQTEMCPGSPGAQRQVWPHKQPCRQRGVQICYLFLLQE